MKCRRDQVFNPVNPVPVVPQRRVVYDLIVPGRPNTPSSPFQSGRPSDLAINVGNRTTSIRSSPSAINSTTATQFLRRSDLPPRTVTITVTDPNTGLPVTKTGYLVVRYVDPVTEA